MRSALQRHLARGGCSELAAIAYRAAASSKACQRLADVDVSAMRSTFAACNRLVRVTRHQFKGRPGSMRAPSAGRLHAQSDLWEENPWYSQASQGWSLACQPWRCKAHPSHPGIVLWHKLIDAAVPVCKNAVTAVRLCSACSPAKRSSQVPQRCKT